MLSKKHYLLFLLLLLLMSWNFGYHRMIFYLPQSNASWRQADCASFALNYYQNGMKFFKPKVHNMLNNGGYAVGECPYYYYFIALLYHLLGQQDVIYKIVSVFIFFSGLFALFRITYRLTKDIFYAYLMPLLTFSVPLLMMFGVSYLPDVPSLSFLLLAFDFLLSYKENGMLKNFFLSMLFFVLAILLKATAVFLFAAAGALFFFELAGWGKWKESEILFRHKFMNSIGFAMVAAIVGGWYSWAISYNELHGVSFLGTKPWPGWPLWEADDAAFTGTIRSFFYYAESMFNIILTAILFFLIPFIVLNRQHLSAFLSGLYLMVFAGVVMFLAYFFAGMRDQAYYYVNLSVLPVMTFVFSLIILKNKYPRVFHSYLFKAFTAALLLHSIDNAQASLNLFFNGGKRHERLNENLYNSEIRAYMQQAGMGRDEKIISIPDVTPDVSLYLLNRPGWTNFNYPQFTPGILDKCITDGARYLVISDTSVFFNPGINQYLAQPLGNFGNVYFYRLTDLKKISLKTASGSFVCAEIESTRMLYANKQEARAWESFILKEYNGKIALRADNGKLVTVLPENDYALAATSDEITEKELFEKIEMANNKIALRAFNGKFVGIEKSKGNRLTADKDSVEAEGVMEIVEYH